MVFSYWEGSSAVSDLFLDVWRPYDPEVRVFTAADVESFIPSSNPVWLELFKAIRLLACKSDVARLVILEHVGGFYLDIHSAPRDGEALARLQALLLTYEFVLFRAVDYLETGNFYIPNGALLGRRNSSVIHHLIESAFHVLVQQRDRENASQGHASYNIAELTGGWLYGLKLLDMDAFPFDPTPAYRDRVWVEDVHSARSHPAFIWYANYGYRRPGEHWSERQATEPLFTQR